MSVVLDWVESAKRVISTIVGALIWIIIRLIRRNE
jgi:hypothetical protein